MTISKEIGMFKGLPMGPRALQRIAATNKNQMGQNKLSACQVIVEEVKLSEAKTQF